MYNMDSKISSVQVIVALLSVFFCSNILFGQFFMSAEIRPRFEYRNGYGRLPALNDKPAYFVSQRSRLNIHFINSKFKSVLTFQDVRVWGDAAIYKSTGVHGNDASIDLYQGYFEWFFDDRSSVCVGRQVLAYDDERLFSIRNWNQHGLAYDALLLKTKFDHLDIHVGLSLNNNRENKYGNIYEQDKMKILNFIHLQRSLENIGHFSLIAVGSGYTASDSSEVIYMRGTAGGFLLMKLQRFDYSFSAYYQFGNNRFGKPVQAYLLTSSLNWHNRLLSLTAGIDYISGNAQNNNDDKDRMFSLLYGARHRYYGFLDYFSNIPKATNSRGLVDIWLRMSSEIASGSSIRADFHRFSVQENQPEFSDFLGTELDIMLSKQFTPELKLTGGFSIFNSSKYYRVMQPNIDSDQTPIWAWIMLDFKLNLFESE